jgi:cation:H+ antiporter
MTWIFFASTALVIVVAGSALARYGDVIGEKTGLGRSWIGVVLLAATTSLPELFTGFGSTALADLPDIAVGDVIGSCMFNLLILSFMDAIQPEPLGTRAHQGHALSIGFGLLLMGIAAFALVAAPHVPVFGWISAATPVLIVLYLVAMRVIFLAARRRHPREIPVGAEQLHYAATPLRTAVLRYTGAGILVVAGALWLPRLGAQIARETGLGDAVVGSLFVAIATSLPEIVVSITAVRIGAIDLGIGNVLGSNLFNLLILGLDDVFYRPGPLLAGADTSHIVTMLAVVTMNALFLIGLTYRVTRKRFLVTWDTGAIAVVYVIAAVLLSRA